MKSPKKLREAVAQEVKMMLHASRDCSRNQARAPRNRAELAREAGVAPKDLRAAIVKLSSRSRRVIELRYGQNLSLREIAYAFGWKTRERARQVIALARQELRNNISRDK